MSAGRAVRYLTSLKKLILSKLAQSAFRLINPFYVKLFSSQIGVSKGGLPRQALDSIDLFRLHPFFAGLDSELNYFVLDASFGDKWVILSLLEPHLKAYPGSRIISTESDKGLVELFIHHRLVSDRFIFVSDASLKSLTPLFRATGKLSLPLEDKCDDGVLSITGYYLKHGLPPGSIRHLHAVHYPYLCEFFHLHGVSYATIVKVLLYLPASVKTSPPCYYGQSDYDAAKAIVSLPCDAPYCNQIPSILFNAVNFSHASLSSEQLSLVISVLESHGFRVLVNVSQAPEVSGLNSLVSKSKHARLVEVPPRLLALVGDNVMAVIGVLGGAMNIAVQFGNSHVLSLQTLSLWSGCDEGDLMGEWGKEKVWELMDQDWPCLRPGRVVVNTFIGDPATLANESLIQALESFVQQLPPGHNDSV